MMTWDNGKKSPQQTNPFLKRFSCQYGVQSLCQASAFSIFVLLFFENGLLESSGNTR